MCEDGPGTVFARAERRPRRNPRLLDHGADDECEPEESSTSSRARASAFAAGFGRTHQSRAAIDDCPFQVARSGCGLLDVWVYSAEQAHRCVHGDRCFAPRSDAVAQRPFACERSCSMACTSGTPRECSGLILAMRTAVLAQLDSLCRRLGRAPPCPRRLSRSGRLRTELILGVVVLQVFLVFCLCLPEAAGLADLGHHLAGPEA